jgi:hypothetical protein
MAQRKPYNPNTKYGRRKLREQAHENYQNMTPAEQDEYNMNGCIFTVVILVVIGGIIYLFSGPEGLLKWLIR